MLDGPPRASAESNVNDWATYRNDDADGFRTFFTEGKLQGAAGFDRDFVCWMLEDHDAATVQRFADISAQMPPGQAAALNESSVELDFRAELTSLHESLPLLYIVKAASEGRVRCWSAEYTPDARIEAQGEHMMFWEQSGWFKRCS